MFFDQLSKSPPLSARRASLGGGPLLSPRSAAIHTGVIDSQIPVEQAQEQDLNTALEKITKPKARKSESRFDRQKREKAEAEREAEEAARIAEEEAAAEQEGERKKAVAAAEEERQRRLFEREQEREQERSRREEERAAREREAKEHREAMEAKKRETQKALEKAREERAAKLEEAAAQRERQAKERRELAAEERRRGGPAGSPKKAAGQPPTPEALERGRSMYDMMWGGSAADEDGAEEQQDEVEEQPAASPPPKKEERGRKDPVSAERLAEGRAARDSASADRKRALEEMRERSRERAEKQKREKEDMKKKVEENRQRRLEGRRQASSPDGSGRASPQRTGSSSGSKPRSRGGRGEQSSPQLSPDRTGSPYRAGARGGQPWDPEHHLNPLSFSQVEEQQRRSRSRSPVKDGTTTVQSRLLAYTASRSGLGVTTHQLRQEESPAPLPSVNIGKPAKSPPGGKEKARRGGSPSPQQATSKKHKKEEVKPVQRTVAPLGKFPYDGRTRNSPTRLQLELGAVRRPPQPQLRPGVPNNFSNLKRVMLQLRNEIPSDQHRVNLRKDWLDDSLFEAVKGEKFLDPLIRRNRRSFSLEGDLNPPLRRWARWIEVMQVTSKLLTMRFEKNHRHWKRLCRKIVLLFRYRLAWIYWTEEDLSDDERAGLNNAFSPGGTDSFVQPPHGPLNAEAQAADAIIDNSRPPLPGWRNLDDGEPARQNEQKKRYIIICICNKSESSQSRFFHST